MPTTAKKSTSRKAPSSAAPKQVTSAATWRSGKDQGHLITLPSGNVARCRRTLNLPELLAKGKIPNPLAPLLNDMLSQGKQAAISIDQADSALILQMVQLIDSQIPKIFIEPRVEQIPADWDEDEQGQWEPSEDAIALHEIDPEDKMFAFTFAQGGPDDVATFREKSKEAMESVANEQNLAREAERLGGVG